jgi:hypothetical protein
MDVAAVLPHELRLFLVAFAAAAASYLLLTSFAFTPASGSTPVVRAPHTVRVIHIPASSLRPVVRGGAHR